MPTINSLTSAALPLDPTIELAGNLAGADRKMAAGDITAVNTAAIAAETVARIAADTTLTTNSMPKTGGTFTGTVEVPIGVGATEAVQKTYVDGLFAGAASAIGASLDATATATTLPATAISAGLGVATNTYVADKIKEDITKKNRVNVGSLALTDLTNKGIIEVERSATTICTITLADSSTLTNPEDYDVTIVDYGNNAEANNITIEAFPGETVEGAASITIDTDGASVMLSNNGGTPADWYRRDLINSSTTTAHGTMVTATNIEAAALTEATKATTSAGIGAALDASIYNTTQVAVTPYTILESDKLLYNTHAAGPKIMYLPDTTSFTVPANRVVIKIVDAATPGAGTNSISVRRSGTDTISGAADDFIIDGDKMGVTFFLDGTNWLPIDDTQGASALTPSTPWTVNGTGYEIYYEGAVGLGKIIIGDISSSIGMLTLDKNAGTEDCDISFSQGGTAYWMMGLDDTDKDFKIAQSSSLGTNDVLKIADTNEHWAIGPTAIAAGSGYKIQNTADAPAQILEIRNDAGDLVFIVNNNRTGYFYNGLAIGNDAPVPDQRGVTATGSWFTRGYHAGLTTIGSDIELFFGKHTTANPGFDHVGLELEVSGGDNNYAIITAPGGGNVGFGTVTPNASSILELSSTTQTMVITRATGAQIELISAIDGAIAYATAGTGVTVNAVGFWGYIAGTWTAL